MKKSIKEYKIEAPHFEWYATVIVGETIDDVIEYAMDKYDTDVGDALGFTMINQGTGSVYIGLAIDADEESIWHEALHCAFSLMRDRGIDFNQEEVMAYTQSFIVRQIKLNISKFDAYIHN
jgi:hypothetical protein